MKAVFSIVYVIILKITILYHGFDLKDNLKLINL